MLEMDKPKILVLPVIVMLLAAASASFYQKHYEGNIYKGPTVGITPSYYIYDPADGLRQNSVRQHLLVNDGHNPYVVSNQRPAALDNIKYRSHGINAGPTHEKVEPNQNSRSWFFPSRYLFPQPWLKVFASATDSPDPTSKRMPSTSTEHTADTNVNLISIPAEKLQNLVKLSNSTTRSSLTTQEKYLETTALTSDLEIPNRHIITEATQVNAEIPISYAVTEADTTAEKFQTSNKISSEDNSNSNYLRNTLYQSPEETVIEAELQLTTEKTFTSNSVTLFDGSTDDEVIHEAFAEEQHLIVDLIKQNHLNIFSTDAMSTVADLKWLLYSSTEKISSPYSAGSQLQNDITSTAEEPDALLQVSTVTETSFEIEKSTAVNKPHEKSASSVSNADISDQLQFVTSPAPDLIADKIFGYRPTSTESNANALDEISSTAVSTDAPSSTDLADTFTGIFTEDGEASDDLNESHYVSNTNNFNELTSTEENYSVKDTVMLIHQAPTNAVHTGDIEHLQANNITVADLKDNLVNEVNGAFVSSAEVSEINLNQISTESGTTAANTISFKVKNDGLNIFTEPLQYAPIDASSTIFVDQAVTEADSTDVSEISFYNQLMTDAGTNTTIVTEIAPQRASSNWFTEIKAIPLIQTSTDFGSTLETEKPFHQTSMDTGSILVTEIPLNQVSAERYSNIVSEMFYHQGSTEEGTTQITEMSNINASTESGFTSSTTVNLLQKTGDGFTAITKIPPRQMSTEVGSTVDATQSTIQATADLLLTVDLINAVHASIRPFSNAFELEMQEISEVPLNQVTETGIAEVSEVLNHQVSMENGSTRVTEMPNLNASTESGLTLSTSGNLHQKTTGDGFTAITEMPPRQMSTEVGSTVEATQSTIQATADLLLTVDLINAVHASIRPFSNAFELEIQEISEVPLNQVTETGIAEVSEVLNHQVSMENGSTQVTEMPNLNASTESGLTSSTSGNLHQKTTGDGFTAITEMPPSQMSTEFGSTADVTKSPGQASTDFGFTVDLIKAIDASIKPSSTASELEVSEVPLDQVKTETGSTVVTEIPVKIAPTEAGITEVSEMLNHQVSIEDGSTRVTEMQNLNASTESGFISSTTTNLHQKTTGDGSTSITEIPLSQVSTELDSIVNFTKTPGQA